MKPTFAMPLKLTASLFIGVTGVIGAAYAASFVITDYTPHHFAHMDAPLWTDKPVRIARDTQALERLPALLATTDVAAQTKPLDNGTVSYVNATAPNNAMDQNQTEISLAGTPKPQMVADAGVVDTNWCFAQYRSYRAEDNSYQPFDGGPRRQCVPESASY